jgi:hypothetical protein
MNDGFCAQALELLRGGESSFAIYEDDEVTATLQLGALVLAPPSKGKRPCRLGCRLEVVDAKSGKLVDVKEEEVHFGEIDDAITAHLVPAKDAHLERAAAKWREEVSLDLEPDQLGELFPHDILPEFPFMDVLAKYLESGPPPPRPTGRFSAAAREDLLAHGRLAPEKAKIGAFRVVGSLAWKDHRFLLAEGPTRDEAIEAHASVWLDRPKQKPLNVFFVGWDGQDGVHQSLIDGDTSRAFVSAMRELAKKSKLHDLAGWLELDLLELYVGEPIDWRAQADWFDVEPTEWLLGEVMPEPTEDDRRALLEAL